MRDNFRLMFIGFFQLLFLSANTFFIANKFYPMIFVSAILTNIIFAIAIKKLVFGNFNNILSYAIGCSCGCVIGTYLASMIFSM